MDGDQARGSEARFAAYVEALGAVLGHADRQQPMHDYCLGLLMPIERKSVEPMAAVTAPAQVAAKHQSLLHSRIIRRMRSSAPIIRGSRPSPRA
jgi:SRSO17 transposase